MLINLKKKLTLAVVAVAPKYIIIGLLLLVFHFAQAQEDFTLDAHVSGYPDSVRVLINKVFDNHEIDRENEYALYLINGRFTFMGAVEKSTLFLSG